MPTSSMTSGLSSTANKVHFYVEQVKGMAEFKLATLYVDYQHLLDSHDLLAKAITDQYYRCVVEGVCGTQLPDQLTGRLTGSYPTFAGP